MRKRNKVVNINEDDFDVYIGRPSKWGNPYHIGKDGNRMEVVDKYREYIRNNKKLLGDIKELNGKTLGCFCAPKPCHGDVLIELLNEIKNKETFFGGKDYET